MLGSEERILAFDLGCAVNHRAQDCDDVTMPIASWMPGTVDETHGRIVVSRLHGQVIGDPVASTKSDSLALACVICVDQVIDSNRVIRRAFGFAASEHRK